MTPQLPGEEEELLRSTSAEVNCSMEKAAQVAIGGDTDNVDTQFRTTVASIVGRDRELLDRLAR